MLINNNKTCHVAGCAVQAQLPFTGTCSKSKRLRVSARGGGCAPLGSVLQGVYEESRLRHTFRNMLNVCELDFRAETRCDVSFTLLSSRKQAARSLTDNNTDEVTMKKNIYYLNALKKNCITK